MDRNQRGGGDPERPPRGAEALSERATYPWWLMWLVFLPFGAPTIVALMHSHPSPLRLVLTLVGAALFLGLYVLSAWQSGTDLASATPPHPRGELSLWLPLALMTALAVALTASNGPVWGALFIFTIAAAAGRLSFAKALAAIVVLVLIIVLGSWRTHIAFGDALQAVIAGLVTAAATLTIVHSVRANQALRAEREEMARLAAASAERLRIARDLHDLLGHSLSLIALKSELAGRLAVVAPERAAGEVRDIEAVARQALQEVRQAVAGYRQPTLGEELRAAREMLAAAGITFALERDDELEGQLTPAAEGVLGWAVREGVTNVIRHSHAHMCRLHLRSDAKTAQLELLDDGAATATLAQSSSGSGLRGLAERVEALRGSFDAGPAREGGFRLAVSLPLSRRETTPRAAGPASMLRRFALGRWTVEENETGTPGTKTQNEGATADDSVPR